MKSLLVIIPAYNEAETIVKVVASIPPKIDGVDTVTVLVVDDGSTDDTADVVRRETSAHVLRHQVNRGVGAAFHTGLHRALEIGADILVTIDADGQFDAADIPKLVEPIIRGEFDFVTVSRFLDKGRYPNQMPKLKIWGNLAIAYLISWVIARRVTDVSCGFRAYSRNVLLNLNLFGDFTYTQETIIDLTFKKFQFLEIPSIVSYFPGRKSRVANNLFLYAIRSLRIIFRIWRDYRPLYFFGSISLMFGLLGTLMILFGLGHYFYSGAFTPYKSVMFAGGFFIIIAMGSGMLGFIADMLKRIRLNQEKILFYEKSKNFEQK